MSKYELSSTVAFLKKLKNNNNRDWFAKNKNLYLKEHENMIAFADAILAEMQKHDHIETPSGKKSLHRIYRDVRFSKDKSPYHNNWSGGFRRATKLRRGGYYFHIEPGNSFVAGGFFGPEPKDLDRIRQDIALNHADWKKILSNKKIKTLFGELKGEKLKTAPRGFEKDNPGVEYLKHKQFILEHYFTDKEVLSPNFAKEVSNTFKAMRPWLDYMSEVLTTDANGIVIV